MAEGLILAGSGGCMRELAWQIQELNKQSVLPGLPSYRFQALYFRLHRLRLPASHPDPGLQNPLSARHGMTCLLYYKIQIAAERKRHEHDNHRRSRRKS